MGQYPRSQWANGTLYSLAVVLLSQTDDQTYYQSRQNRCKDKGQDKQSLPPSSPCNIFVIPHIRQLLTTRSRYVPDAVGRRRLLIAVPGWVSQIPPSAEWTMVSFPGDGLHGRSVAILRNGGKTLILWYRLIWLRGLRSWSRHGAIASQSPLEAPLFSHSQQE